MEVELLCRRIRLNDIQLCFDVTRMNLALYPLNLLTLLPSCCPSPILQPIVRPCRTSRSFHSVVFHHVILLPESPMLKYSSLR